MPRITPIDPSTATGDLAALLDTARRMFGGTPNLVTTAAHSPAALGTMLQFFGGLSKATLGAKVGEQIAITIAQDNRCGYCLSAHTVIGRMRGLTSRDLEAARTADAADPKAAATLRLAAAVNRSRGQIDDATFAAARAAGLTDGEIVEVVAHVALNVFTNYLNSVAQTTIDFPEVAVAA
jgi:uncharacterized peroxidase-related enzyme